MAEQKSCQFAGFEHCDDTSICRSGKWQYGARKETEKSYPCSRYRFTISIDKGSEAYTF